MDEVAAALGDNEELRIGKLDATQNKNSASAFNITGFPTLVYLKQGVVGRYEGPRTADGLLTFMRRMSSPVVTEVSDLSELSKFYEIHPIAFALTLPVADYIESDGWRSQFEVTAKQQHLHTSFVVLTSAEATSPSISKHENGRPAVFFAKKTSLKISSTEIEEFVTQNNVPFMNKFDNHNFKKLGSLGNVLAIVAVDYAQESETANIIQSLDIAATSLPESERDKLVFGHIDGVKWIKFLRQYDVEMTPTFLLLDVALDLHITVNLKNGGIDEHGNSILPATVASVLEDYFKGSINMKAMKPPSMIQKAIKKMRSYYPWSILCIVPVMLMVLSFFLPYPEDGKQKKA